MRCFKIALCSKNDSYISKISLYFLTVSLSIALPISSKSLSSCFFDIKMGSEPPSAVCCEYKCQSLSISAVIIKSYSLSDIFSTVVDHFIGFCICAIKAELKVKRKMKTNFFQQNFQCFVSF